MRSRFIVYSFLIVISLSCYSQTLTQFNGALNITTKQSLGGGMYSIVGAFSDPTLAYTGVKVAVGDQILDINGICLSVNEIVSAGPTIISVKCSLLDAGKIPATGKGIIFRPSEKGYPLIAASVSQVVLSKSINSSLLSVTKDFPSITASADLPPLDREQGDLIANSTGVYMLDISGWVAKSSTSKPILPGTVLAIGTIIQVTGATNRGFWVSTGTQWSLIETVTDLPKIPRFGDICYLTGENKLYMLVDDIASKKWMSISSSVAGGALADRPTMGNRIGDLYFDTDENILYVFDSTNNWVVVSTNGSVPTGDSNPDLTLVAVKEGSLFYNTYDHTLYVCSNNKWISLSDKTVNADNIVLYQDMLLYGTENNNAAMYYKYEIPLSGFGLTKASILVGDDDDKASIVSPDAFPLSNFGSAKADISMSSEGTAYNIVGLKNPINAQDAATKNYVDGLRGSIPALEDAPTDPVPVAGNSYFDTGDKIVYVFDGTSWVPETNLLSEGNLYVGNSSGVAASTAKSDIPLSGFGLTKDNLLVGDDDGKSSFIAPSALPLSNFGSAKANISMSSDGTAYNIVGLKNPSNAQDAATKNYVDGLRGSIPALQDAPTDPVPVAGNSYFDTDDKMVYVFDGEKWVPETNLLSEGNLYVGNSSGVAASTAKSDIPLSGFGLTKDNLLVGDDDGKSSFIAPSALPLSNFGSAKANISMSSEGTAYNIVGLKNPINDQDAATKNYVDGLRGSIPALEDAPTDPVPVAGNSYFDTGDKMVYVFDGTSWVPETNLLSEGNLYVGNSSGVAASTAKSDIPLSGFGLTKDNLLVGDDDGKSSFIAPSALPLSNFGSAKANISMSSEGTAYNIVGLKNPINAQDAATKNYVDGLRGSIPALEDAPTDPVPVAGNSYFDTGDKIVYVFDGTGWVPETNLLSEGNLYVGNSSGVAASTAKSDIPLSGFGLTKDNLLVGDDDGKSSFIAPSALPLSNFGSAKANISMSSDGTAFNIVGLKNPINAQDAATKNYVDGLRGSIPTLEDAPTDPVPVAGNSYFDTGDKMVYVFDGTSWVPETNLLSEGNLYVGNSSGVAASTAKSDIPLSGFGVATQNIAIGTNYLSTNAQADQGLQFEVGGNAKFAQDITVMGNINTPSDLRLKTNIVTLGNVLQAIDAMRGVRFEYIDQKKYAKGPKIGVIAQELQKVYPEMVVKGADGFLKVDYTQLTGVLIQAVKEQQQQMNQQQLEIDELKVRLDKQQQQINSILNKSN